MHEQSKAAKRRYNDGAFHSRYFVGNGIDIGGAPDPLAQYSEMFLGMEEVQIWDIGNGDAQYMKGVPNDHFDFVHSSHCLEHMVDVNIALENWIRILKPGGYLIITVPDEDLYEHCQWPSRFNSDHKWSFTLGEPTPTLPKSINVLDLARKFSEVLKLERLVLQKDFFREMIDDEIDQTLTPVAECAIEIIWFKRT